MENNMKVNIIKVKSKEKEFIFIKINKDLKENGLKIKDKVGVLFIKAKIK